MQEKESSKEGNWRLRLERKYSFFGEENREEEKEGEEGNRAWLGRGVP
ncbi:MAG: hypothetical protein AABX02_04130 [archaeon]